MHILNAHLLLNRSSLTLLAQNNSEGNRTIISRAMMMDIKKHLFLTFSIHDFIHQLWVEKASDQCSKHINMEYIQRRSHWHLVVVIGTLYHLEKRCQSWDISLSEAFFSILTEDFFQKVTHWIKINIDYMIIPSTPS